VLFPWGRHNVKGTIAEVYGHPPRLMVVINITPEMTGSVIDEPTTAVWPLDEVRLVKNAA
jgi:hypothetical protein